MSNPTPAPSGNLPLRSLSLILGLNALFIILIVLEISDVISVLQTHKTELQPYITKFSMLVMGLFISWALCIYLLLYWRRNLLQEVNQRERAETELLAKSRLLDNIITNLPVSLFAKDAKDNYRWILWNRKSEELFDLKNADVLGKTDYELFPRHEADFFRNTDIKVMTEGKVVEIEEEEVTTSRGTWLAHTIKVPIADETGKPSVMLGILEDITIRKQQANQQLQAYAEELELKNLELEHARRRAEAADKAKSDFLATMSHEIRTPLNGIIGTADLLGRTTLSAQQEDYAATIRKSGENLLYIINDILDVTKLESRQVALENIAFNLAQTAEDIISIHSAAASQKGLDLLLRYAPHMPEWITGDPGRIRQILNNLLGNAIKFTQTGYILVDIGFKGEKTPSPGQSLILDIKVEDTGIGISPENLERVFERFTQAEASTNRKFGGSGLGLTICKQLTELMDGTIDVTSTLSKGSTFHVTLPVKTTLPEKPAGTKEAGISLAGKHIALVDDNAINLGILEEQVLAWGGQPQPFSSGAHLLSWLADKKQEHGLHAAIIDHNMPDMSGADLGKSLRQNPATATLPLLAFSSQGQRGDAALFTSSGFNGYLVKPARPDILKNMLEAIIGQPASSRPNLLTRHNLEETQTHKDTLPQTGGKNVLVVEDDAVNRKVISLMLEEMGHNVQVAEDGTQGLKVFQEQTFDLVLMDMQMPELDGPATTRLIRQWEKQENLTPTPIVALTANALEEHKKLCLEAGMNGYLTKPVTRAKLAEQLSMFMQQAAKNN